MVAPLRKSLQALLREHTKSDRPSANLARAGHSVFLLEAGGDNGNNLTDLVPQRYLANSESDNASWSFFVSHFQNETQARRDDKFTYRLNNGSYYVGLDPPEDAEP